LSEEELTAEMRDYRDYASKNLIMEAVDDKDAKTGAGTKLVNLDAVINGVTDEHIRAFVDEDVTMSANGIFYRRDPKSFYSVLIEDLLNKRVEYKNKAKEAEKMIVEIEKEMKRRNIE
jgi:hypothetical protein